MIVNSLRKGDNKDDNNNNNIFLQYLGLPTYQHHVVGVVAQQVWL